ncbi:MAG: DNA polymerase III subunit delta [Mycoplasmoidaceae bacterium]
MIILINSPDIATAYFMVISRYKYEKIDFNNVERSISFSVSTLFFGGSKNLVIYNIQKLNNNLNEKNFFYNFIDNYKGNIFIVNLDREIGLSELKIDKIITFQEINYKNINKIICFFFKKYQINCKIAIVNYLSKIIPFDYNIINSEIGKLSLINNKEIEVYHINEVCSVYLQESFFKIIFYFLEKKYLKSFLIFNYYINKNVNIDQIFSIFVTQLHKIKIYLFFYKKLSSFDLMAAKFNLKKYEASIIKNIFNHISENGLKKIIEDIYEIESKVKIKNCDRLILLKLFFLKNCNDIFI